MCDIGKAVSRAFTAPGTGGAEAALIQQSAALAEQQKRASDAAEKALKLQEAALKRAEAAAVPVADSESARRAAEDRIRRVTSASAFASRSAQQFFGDAPIGFRMLMGA